MYHYNHPERVQQRQQLQLIQAIRAERKALAPDHKFQPLLRNELKRLRASVAELCEDPLEERVAIAKRIELVQESHQLPVYVWGRDCDMVESDCVTIIPATVMGYIRFEEEQYRWAEGPTTVCMINHAEYAGFKRTRRDRIGEAWDNGNTTPFYV